MKLYAVRKVLEVCGFTFLSVAGASAITVQEVGVNPYQTPTISVAGFANNVTVYAGVNQLVVDGVAMNGFCIDPFHWSLSSSSGYSYVPLTSAPKGHVMSADVALDIERLWGSFYGAALSSADSAAGLQIAIWKLVGGSDFTLNSANDYGAAGMITAVTDVNYSGPVADLVALTGPGQDYVVPGTSQASPVPDGGTTVMLLGGALCGLAFIRRKAWTN